MTQLLIVKVGSDDIPAFQKDIDEVTKQIDAHRSSDSNLIVFPHNVEFETINIQSDELLIVKVGSDKNPATYKDLKQFQATIEEALRYPDELCKIIAHHAFEYQIVKKNFFKK